MSNLNSPRLSTRYSVLALITVAAFLLFSSLAIAQTTISTGSIVGTVTDPQGAVLDGAKVSITNTNTGQTISLVSNSAGAYNSGALAPGAYKVQVSAKGFSTSSQIVTVLVGTTATFNAKLLVGQESQVVEVQGSSVAVNTVQAIVQGVVTADQIDNLPANGRNFLDLAQLEPGVQIQEGSTFDPTKNGYSSISFGGRYGRTARIEIDGVDISDETVGTTTMNIPASAIQEFALEQSNLDLSTELTSSGAVNVTTRSGTNALHGEAFGLFRGNQTSARLPGNPAPPFQREQFGGRVGGYVIKDRLFWFIDAERIKQDTLAAEPFVAPFDTLATSLGKPFRDTLIDGRLDWNIRASAKLFYRFNFDENSQIGLFGTSSSTQGFKNFDHTPSHTVGLDFNTGTFTHSFRFELLEFRNSIVDGEPPQGISNPIPGLGINIGAAVLGSCVLSGGGNFCAGPNLLAPQATPQSDHQIKYDGSKLVHNHLLRYGFGFNHIQGGGFAGFFSFPQVGTTTAGASNDPTSYPSDYVFMGNGVGFSTPFPAFGYPGGGLGPDNRVEAYVGDQWRVRSNFSLELGLHYVHDTGRVDSDLGPLPALNQWGPGLGNRVRTPGTNFGPELGIAWDVKGNGKTVVRAGGGLFYENSIWNNIFFDSPGRAKTGILANTPLACFAGSPLAFPWPSDPGAVGTPIAGGAGLVTAAGQVSANFCSTTDAQGNAQNLTIAQAAPAILALSDAFKAAAAANPATPQPNPNYIGNTLNAATASGLNPFFPGYRTPRSWQMNIGIQHEIRPGMVFSADYVRNIGEHFLIVFDPQHSGAARSFNQANAIAARDAAQAANGCPAGSGGAGCVYAAQLAAATAANPVGTPLSVLQSQALAGSQAAYSGAGLDSNIQVTGGAPCPTCAFPGFNSVSGNSGNLGTLDMLFPEGRSVYSGLQMKLVQKIANPMRGVKAANLQVSYALAKFTSQVVDQDFVNVARNNDNVTQFTGPNGLDRRHQFSFGGTFDLPFFTRLSVVGHFYSPLPQNLTLPQLTSGGEIFATDWVGSGLQSSSPGEPLPGTQIGQFERGTNAGNLQNVINNYNNKFAGTLTPAGQAVVSSGVMTAADMATLGWVMPQLGTVAPGASDFGWLKGFDFKAAWPIKIRENLKVEPSVSFFNLFNFANQFLGGNLPQEQLTPSDPTCSATGTCATTPLAPNVVGGVNRQSLLPFRATFGSGTYAFGAPRQIEFGLKVDF
ncbi:MAG TPA: carboxypeptidase regulatory-like domain-containing protein [Candidatus Sulfotelmatobacter sp.]|nr:carboxypeptidase regulatory-like domain-containing protein [Candidatus Sulfotelmatobacter sp.]